MVRMLSLILLCTTLSWSIVSAQDPSSTPSPFRIVTTPQVQTAKLSDKFRSVEDCVKRVEDSGWLRVIETPGYMSFQSIPPRQLELLCEREFWLQSNPEQRPVRHIIEHWEIMALCADSKIYVFLSSCGF